MMKLFDVYKLIDGVITIIGRIEAEDDKSATDLAIILFGKNVWII